MTVDRTLERQAFLVGSIIVVAGLIAASETLHDRSQQIIVWSEGLMSRFPTGGMFVFVVLSMMSAMLAFFSAVIFAPVAVYPWGPTTSFALLWIGWLVGGVASYWVGRFLGRSVVARLVGEDRIAGWRGQLVGRKKFIPILLFVMIVPSEIPAYLLGILRYQFSYSLAALAIGVMPYAFATIFLGDWFLEGRGLSVIVLGAGVLLGGVIYQFYGRPILGSLKR